MIAPTPQTQLTWSARRRITKVCHAIERPARALSPPRPTARTCPARTRPRGTEGGRFSTASATILPRGSKRIASRDRILAVVRLVRLVFLAFPTHSLRHPLQPPPTRRGPLRPGASRRRARHRRSGVRVVVQAESALDSSCTRVQPCMGHGVNRVNDARRCMPCMGSNIRRAR